MPIITHDCPTLDLDKIIKGVVIFKTVGGETTCYCNACKTELIPCVKLKEEE